MPITLRPYQVVAMENRDRLKQNNRFVLNVLPTGSGKCHGLNTPILMHDGSVKMVQDVVVGDELMGPDSKPRTVLSLVRGQETLYKVIPVKGDPYIVNESHILSLKQTGLKSQPKYKSQEGKGKIVNISVKDYLKSSNTFKHTHKGWRTGVDFPYSFMPDDPYLPPYLLGLWLGDGTTLGKAITTADQEIVDYLYDFAAKSDQSITKQQKPNNAASTYDIVAFRRRNYSTFQSLKSIGVIGNKHIPREYKIASRNQRLELLAGILDSDGHFDHQGYDVVFKVKQLAEDLVFLVRSLGFAAYMKPCRKTCYNTGVTGDYFRISISGDTSVIPTKLKRHQSEGRKQIKSVLVTGITLENIGVGDYYGFEIDGDHLYLLGDFTVTHNSICKAWLAKRYYDSRDITIIFAHRDVLLGQISDKLCIAEVPHTFITSDKTRRNITNANLVAYGDSFYDESSPIILISVDTFLARLKSGLLSPQFLSSVKHWMVDESHHVQKPSVEFNDINELLDILSTKDSDTKIGNKWGVCVEALVNADGDGFTATPIRGDKSGLGVGHGGVFQAMSVTTTMWDLIKIGSLTPYKIYTVGQIDTKGMKRNADGDFNQRQLYLKTKEADITGDSVAHYKKYLNGQPVITFCVNVEHATEVAGAFNAAGVPSRVVNAKTPDGERQAALKDLREGRLLNLVNVDLFGEGFDAPAVAGVIMLRSTESYSLFKQQFGRMLRPSDGKAFGTLIDHVGNVKFFMEEYRLLTPHDDPEWTLESRRTSSKRKNDDGPLPETIECGECHSYGLVMTVEKAKMYDGQAFVFVDGKCPSCGHCESEKEHKTRIRELKIKEGDLVPLEIDAIEALIAARNDMMKPVTEFRKTVEHSHFKFAALNNFATRQHRLDTLRFKIQQWCRNHGLKTGQSVELVQLDFERQFGINIFKAQTGSANDMLELSGKIERCL